MEGAISSIVRPPIAADNFELKPNFIQMVQQMFWFDSFQDEDPYAHLTNFLEISDTFKVNGVDEDEIRLRLFLFSVRGRAKQWLSSLLQESITTRSQVAEKFLTHYFHPIKVTEF